VIALHEVKDARQFARKMAWLRAAYDVVPLADLATRPVGARTVVALTFDDGYGCWHEVAAPILRDLGLPATFFVCSGFVGLDDAGADEFRRRCLGRSRPLRPLSHRELVELAAEPLFEIGGHTRHHVDLGLAHAPHVLEDEIAGDRRRLEDWTGRPVPHFAYPFGGPRNLSPAAVACVKAAGFRAAFTFVPGFFDDERTDVFRVRRDGLDERDSPALWQAWLGGAYDEVYAMKERLGQAVAR
jgi:peptidoglycan/xylan/chitin deacetylase (PgdA/CDA1 family)